MFGMLLNACLFNVSLSRRQKKNATTNLDKSKFAVGIRIVHQECHKILSSKENS